MSNGGGWFRSTLSSIWGQIALLAIPVSVAAWWLYGSSPGKDAKRQAKREAPNEHQDDVRTNVVAWGRNKHGVLGTSNMDGTAVTAPSRIDFPAASRIVKVAAGSSHSLALSADGRVYSWGQGSDGQLGKGEVDSLDIPTLIEEIEDVVDISCGGFHSLCCTASGDVYAWGDNLTAQLGVGNDTASDVPRRVEGDITSHAIVQVSCGWTHSAARTREGLLFMWGNGVQGQLGCGQDLSSSTPRLVVIEDVSAVACGGKHTAAITSNGDLYTWGHNHCGQLGLDDNADVSNVLSPTRVDLPFVTRNVGCGDDFTAIADAEGCVWTCGNGRGGALGNGGIRLQRTFQRITIADCEQDDSNNKVVYVSCGKAHAMAITECGEAFAWGTGKFGRLGLGDQVDKRKPARVPKLSGVLSSAAGAEHTLAVVAGDFGV